MCPSFTELEYYRCLRDIAREYNVEIWCVDFDVGVKLYVKYVRERDEFQPCIVMLPNYDVFIERYSDDYEAVRKLGLSLHDLLKYMVEYVLPIPKLRTEVWRRCRNLIKYGTLLQICEDGFCISYAMEKFGKISEAIVRKNLKNVNGLIKEFKRGVEESIRFSDELIDEAERALTMFVVTGDESYMKHYVRVMGELVKGLLMHFRYAIIMKFVYDKYEFSVYTKYIDELVKNRIISRGEVQIVNDVVQAVEYSVKKRDICECVSRLVEVFKYYRELRDILNYHDLAIEVAKKPTILPIIDLVTSYTEIYLTWADHITMVITSTT